MDCETIKKDDGTIIQKEKPTINAVAVEELKAVEQLPGVHGVSSGKKIVKGKLTDIDAIRVWVYEKKKDVPKSEKIPSEIDGKPTDVIELGEVWAIGKQPKIQATAEAITEKYRPVAGGESICEASGTAGTTMIPGTRYGVKSFLTNTHVCCKTVRKDLKDQRPLEILQPGPYDGGVYPTDVVGDTESAVIFPEGTTAFNDIGSFSIRNVDTDWSPEMHQLFKDYTGGYKMAVGVGLMEVGDTVFKVGRTTGLTEMQVVDLDAPAQVNYSGTDGVVPHKACIIFTAGSAGGDSGSAIFKMIDGKPYLVAYLFAGSSQYTIGHEIQNGLSIMNFVPAWDTGNPEPPLEYDFVIHLTPTDVGGLIKGKVVDKVTGEGVGGAVLDFVKTTQRVTSFSIDRQSIVTDELGEVELELSSAVYDVTVRAVGYLTWDGEITIP